MNSGVGTLSMPGNLPEGHRDAKKEPTRNVAEPTKCMSIVASIIRFTDRDHNQFAAVVCTARTLRSALLTVAAGKQRHSIIANALGRQNIADALQNIGILTIQSNRVRLPDQER